MTDLDLTDRFVRAWPSALDRTDELVAAVEAAAAVVGINGVLQIARTVATQALFARARRDVLAGAQAAAPVGAIALLQTAAGIAPPDTTGDEEDA